MEGIRFAKKTIKENDGCKRERKSNKATERGRKLRGGKKIKEKNSKSYTPT